MSTTIPQEIRKVIDDTIWRDTQDSGIPAWLIESIENTLKEKQQ